MWVSRLMLVIWALFLAMATARQAGQRADKQGTLRMTATRQPQKAGHPDKAASCAACAAAATVLFPRSLRQITNISNCWSGPCSPNEVSDLRVAAEPDTSFCWSPNGAPDPNPYGYTAC